MSEALIRESIEPGDTGSIILMHGELYAREYGFDHTFEAYVAVPLSEFVLRNDPREKIWIVEDEGKVAGSIAICKGSETEAQLRWFIIHPSIRGKGLGRILLSLAIGFAETSGFQSLFLWTVEHLESAKHLYLDAGFTLAEEKSQHIWGVDLTEQKYIMDF